MPVVVPVPFVPFGAVASSVVAAFLVFRYCYHHCCCCFVHPPLFPPPNSRRWVVPGRHAILLSVARCLLREVAGSAVSPSSAEIDATADLSPPFYRQDLWRRGPLIRALGAKRYIP